MHYEKCKNNGSDSQPLLTNFALYPISKSLYNPRPMILLVEDEERARETIGRMLERAGYGVIGAGDGLEALSLLEKRGCDLVLSDILMPNLNGYALVARIRSKWPNMPIILMSGYLPQDAGKRMETILKTQVEFVPKPIDPSALTAIVQRLIPAVTVSNNR